MLSELKTIGSAPGRPAVTAVTDGVLYDVSPGDGTRYQVLLIRRGAIACVGVLGDGERNGALWYDGRVTWLGKPSLYDKAACRYLAKLATGAAGAEKPEGWP